MKQESFFIEKIPAVLWGEKSPKIIIAVHGNMSHKTDLPIEVMAETALKYGYQVLRFDLPEHGDRKNEEALAEPFEGTAERKSADKISVSIEAISTHKVPPMEAGTKIRIVYDGNVAESYPAQINNTVAIYLIDKDGEILND